MYYKLIILCLILVICCCGCGARKSTAELPTYENKKESVELIEQIFNISKSNYKIIEERNELRKSEYRGSYTVILNIDDANMKAFIEEVEEHYGNVESIENYPKGVNPITREELGENDVHYIRDTSVKRKIEGVELVPKTCGIDIVCLEAVDGVHEVIMQYRE